VIALIRRPLDDYFAALTPFATGWRWARLAVFAVALLLTWWVYVPVHELAHAYGCMLGGGTVTRLEIDAVYGAALLQRVFPFVHVGSEYAGRLTGFDTHGSDAVYLLTDFLPFVATIIIGVPLLRAAARPGRDPLAQAALFGAAIPIAYAPFVSLTGDYYEMGSILVSGAFAAIEPGFDPVRWRSDDLFRLIDQLFGTDGTGGAGDALGLSVSFVVGAVLAILTYAAGVLVSRALVESRRQQRDSSLA
jgi:hypothetical protein